MAEQKIYTADEVAQHANNSDCWLIIGNESNGKNLTNQHFSDVLISIYRWQESV